MLTAAVQAQAQPAAPDPAAPTPPAEPPPPPVVEVPPPAANPVEQAKPFEFHGYLRAGTGINVKGGHQEAFGAPGVSKYRLGNETETYGELGLDANWLNPDRTDTWFKTSVKLAIVAARNGTFDVIDPLAVREAYAEAGKVLASKPDMSFWAGQRFYRRRDVHINDFFFNDTSGYGAGFQDLKLGDKAKLHVAYFVGSNGGPGGGTDDLGRFAKNSLDIRVSDIPVGSGNLEIFLLPVVGTRGDAPAMDGDNNSGLAAGVFHFMPLMGGFNEVSAQFGFGGAANLSTGLDTGLDSSGWQLRVVERATIQPTPQLSMQIAGVVQLDNRNGDANGSDGNLWVSVGARPVYSFTKYTGIAIEGGIDVVTPEGDDTETGFVGKLTVAPLIRPAMDFWARPELRAFVTAAFWNETLQGTVGGPAFADDTFGLTAGVQLESWW